MYILYIDRPDVRRLQRVEDDLLLLNDPLLLRQLILIESEQLPEDRDRPVLVDLGQVLLRLTRNIIQDNLWKEIHDLVDRVALSQRKLRKLARVIEPPQTKTTQELRHECR